MGAEAAARDSRGVGLRAINRAVGRGRGAGESHDDKDDRERPWAEESGSASGDGGAQDERQASWQGSGPQVPQALPGVLQIGEGGQLRGQSRGMAEIRQERTPQRREARRESARAASGQQARICRALRFQISRVMLA